MRGRTIALVVGGFCLLVVVPIVALLVLGAGGGLVYWLSADGAWRRGAAGAEINTRLGVTVERATREGAPAPERERLACRMRFENLGDRDIARFSGTILFVDAKGWTVFSCGVDEARPLRAHESAVEEREIECFAYAPSSGSLDGVDPASLTPAWNAGSLELADGTVIDARPAPR